MADDKKRMGDRLTLEIDDPRITADKFAKGVHAFLNVIKEAAKDVSGKPEAISYKAQSYCFRLFRQLAIIVEKPKARKFEYAESSLCFFHLKTLYNQDKAFHKLPTFIFLVL